ncbi:MAG: MoaD/ThiS family protein [Zestosphaera sp.]
MIRVTVEVYASLREKLGWCRKELTMSSPRVLLRDVLESLPDLRKYVIDDAGALRGGFIVLVNGRHVEFTGGLETLLKDNDELAIFPPGGGG